jgi:hypothetical protein
MPASSASKYSRPISFDVVPANFKLHSSVDAPSCVVDSAVAERNRNWSIKTLFEKRFTALSPQVQDRLFEYIGFVHFLLAVAYNARQLDDQFVESIAPSFFALVARLPQTDNIAYNTNDSKRYSPLRIAAASVHAAQFMLTHYLFYSRGRAEQLTMDEKMGDRCVVSRVVAWEDTETRTSGHNDAPSKAERRKISWAEHVLIARGSEFKVGRNRILTCPTTLPSAPRRAQSHLSLRNAQFSCDYQIATSIQR